MSIPKYIGLGLIFVYKSLISPILPSSCRFTPTCSTYAKIAIERFGLIKGSFLATKRIIRCNPKAIGGADPVPYNLKGDFKWLI